MERFSFLNRLLSFISLIIICLPLPLSLQVRADSDLRDLNFDFEIGIAGWTKNGNAFNHQPTFGGYLRTDRIRPEIKDTIGGDYWKGIKHPIGSHGDYWIGTFERRPGYQNLSDDPDLYTAGDSLTGDLISDEFLIQENTIYFLLGGTGGYVELLINSENVKIERNYDSSDIILINGVPYYSMQRQPPQGIEVMSRYSFNTEEYIGKGARLKITDDKADAHINVDDFIFADKDTTVLENYLFRTSYIIKPGTAKTLTYIKNRDVDLPLWGFADTHAHWMNNAGFGTDFLTGRPYGKIDTALKDCSDAHGMGGLKIPIVFYEHLNNHWGFNTTGYPDFAAWPNFKSKIHQSMYIEWVRRAYLGGLRLMVCITSNSELLAYSFGKKNMTDDEAVKIETVYLKKMISDLNEHGENWISIAPSSDSAKKLIMENKLAVIIGMEIDKPGGWVDSRQCTETEIKSYLNKIYDSGIRYIFPVHLADNAFAGFSLYASEQFCINNFYARRNIPELYRYADVDGSALVDFRLGKEYSINFPQVLLVSIFMRYSPPGFNWLLGKSNYKYSYLGMGHVNRKGLTNKGIFAIKEIMKLGMIIDIDHMSFKSNNMAIQIAKNYTSDTALWYPLVAGHTNFLEQELRNTETGHNNEECLNKLRNEHAKTDSTIFDLRDLKGMVAPVTEGGKDVLNYRDTAIVRNDNPGSSKTWAQTYLYALEKMNYSHIALGTDMNGFLTEIAPRFATFSAFSIENDKKRQKYFGGRNHLALIQENGVKYDVPLKNCRFHKFHGKGVFNEDEAYIWQAIFISQASYSKLDNKNHFYADNYNPDYVNGFRNGINDTPPDKLSRDIEKDEAAAYIVSINYEHGKYYNWKQIKSFKKLDHRELERKIQIIEPIYQSWQRMHGNNEPLKRSFISTKHGIRDFDFNIDGLAHYGLLPDFIQDLKNVGLTYELLTPLFNSARDFTNLMKKCEDISKKIRILN